MGEQEPEKAYEFFAEWTVRRIPKPSKEPRETYNQRMKDWVLSSIGLDANAKEIFSYIENSKTATVEDLTEQFNEDQDEIIRNLDLLYSNGLVERLGRAYFVREPVSRSIVKRLIPRITESLRNIARVESKTRADSSYYQKLRGRSFTDVGSAITACKEISHAGASPVARVVGAYSYNDESVEVEGPVLDYGYTPQHLVIVTGSGEKVTIGNRHARGADVKAHSIVIKGDKNE